MNKKLQTWLLCLLLSLSIVFALPKDFALGNTSPVAPVVTEVRGVWVTNVASGVLFMPWGIDRALRQLAQLHFNTIYPVVWNRGYTFYPSTVAQRVTGRSQQPLLKVLHLGQDVLARMVKQGQQRHLRIIPWFEYGFMAPANSELAQLYPDWLTTRRDGSKTIDIQAELPEVMGNAERSLSQTLKNPALQETGNEAWLNPIHPEVQQFLLDLITEVVRQYPVSGIQFDDHFGFPVEFGYDSYTTWLYQHEHGGTSPPNDPFDAEWMRWRADKLTAFIKTIFQTIKAINPDCLISLSPNPQAFAYRAYLQDWETWVEKGWIGELVLQVYRSDRASFQAELNQPAVQAAQKRIPVAIGILTGLTRRPIPFSQIQQQVELVRSHGFKGVSFFYWETLWGYLTPESPQQRRQGFQTLFGEE